MKRGDVKQKVRSYLEELKKVLLIFDASQKLDRVQPIDFAKVAESNSLGK